MLLQNYYYFFSPIVSAQIFCPCHQQTLHRIQFVWPGRALWHHTTKEENLHLFYVQLASSSKCVTSTNFHPPPPDDEAVGAATNQRQQQQTTTNKAFVGGPKVHFGGTDGTAATDDDGTTATKTAEDEAAAENATFEVAAVWHQGYKRKNKIHRGGGGRNLNLFSCHFRHLVRN